MAAAQVNWRRRREGGQGESLSVNWNKAVLCIVRGSTRRGMGLHTESTTERPRRAEPPAAPRKLGSSWPYTCMSSSTTCARPLQGKAKVVRHAPFVQDYSALK